MSLSNVFRCCKYMENFRQFQIFEWKILAKSRFFSRKGRDLDDLVSWFCVYFNLRSFVHVALQVVFVLKSRLCFRCTSRCLSRLCVSSFASTSALIFDIRPIIRHLHTTSFFSSSLTYGLFFYIRLLLSRG